MAHPRYCTLTDVYRQGFPRGSVANGARKITRVDTALDRLELGNHGFEADQAVQLHTWGDAALPAPLSTGVVYYAQPVTDSDSLFQLSLTSGGAAIDLTTEGSGAFGVYVSINEMLLDLIETYSTWFDGKLTGHQVPLTEPYPSVAVHVVAVRTAAHATRVLKLGKDNDPIFEAERLLLSDIPALARGVPLRDERATAPANLSTFAVWGNSSNATRRTR